LPRSHQKKRFSGDWLAFYLEIMERPERTATGKICLTLFTGIGSIPAMGMVKNDVIWKMSD